MLDRPGAILLIQPAKLGDVLLTSALLDDLAAAVPGVPMDFLVGRASAPVLLNHPLIRRRIDYTANPLRDLPVVRAGRYDWVVDPRGSTGTAFLAWASGARVRAGFDVRPPRNLAYTHRLPRSGGGKGGRRAPEYVLRERRRLLDLIGVPTLDTLPRIHLGAAERAAAGATWASLRLPPGQPAVGMSLPGGQPRREWAPERWADVSRILAEGGVTTLVFTGPGDESHVARFRAAGGAGDIVPCRLRELFALQERCDAFASGDTGPAHFARALGVPTVTLHPRGQAVLWNPGGPTSIGLESPADIPCPQCLLPRGEINGVRHDCLQRIPAQAVADALLGLARARAQRNEP